MSLRTRKLTSLVATILLAIPMTQQLYPWVYKIQRTSQANPRMNHKECYCRVIWGFGTTMDVSHLDNGKVKYRGTHSPGGYVAIRNNSLDVHTLA